MQNPWAMLLVLGHKTSEFRPKGTTSKPISGEWVMIIASGAVPKQSTLLLAREDYVRDQGRFGIDEQDAINTFNSVMSFFIPNFEDVFQKLPAKRFWAWPLQSCVGLVKFGKVEENPTQETHKWLHAGDVGSGTQAWEVEDSVLFPHSIPNVQGSLSLRQAFGKTGLNRQEEILETLQNWA